MIQATLGPKTYFCLDVHHNGAHAHFDDVSPGDLVACGAVQFRLGDRIELRPIAGRWGTDFVPNCTKLAEPDGPTLLAEATGEVSRRLNDHPTPTDRVNIDYFKWVYGELDATTHASCQWKGTTAELSFVCACGAHLRIHDDFLYNVACPFCTAVYCCVDRIPLEPIETPTGETHVDPDEVQCDT